MNVILLGFHGSGKTVVGKTLANRLWSTFVDVDDLAAAELARGPSRAPDWLAHVQQTQRSVLAGLRPDGQTIVAASSVAVPEPADVAAVRAHCRLVYLKAEPQALERRIAQDQQRLKGNYPAFRRDQAADVPAGLAGRDGPWAAMADLTLDTTLLTPDRVVALVVRMAM